MSDNRSTRPKIEKKGGYPAGTKPVSQIKPPPPSISKPKSRAS